MRYGTTASSTENTTVFDNFVVLINITLSDYSFLCMCKPITASVT